MEKTYPSDLPQVVTDYIDSVKGLLKEVPIDPFSDKPLVYRKTDDGFILYSVGFDLIDNDGQFGTGSDGKPQNSCANGDYIFWPMDVQ